LPILCARRVSLPSIGTIVSLFNIAGALSGLLAGYRPTGWASSRFLRIPAFLRVSLSICSWLFPQWILVTAFFSGFFSDGHLPLTVTMGQELAPRQIDCIQPHDGLAFGFGRHADAHCRTLRRTSIPIGCLSGCSPWFPVLNDSLIYLLPNAEDISRRFALPERCMGK